MTTPDELIAILNRLLDGSREEQDIEQFRNWTKTGDAQTVIQLVIQLGKYNTNIGEGQGIDIGDRLDTELLKEIRDLVRSPLQTIQSELTVWVGQVRVILTCRLNLWDAIPILTTAG